MLRYKPANRWNVEPPKQKKKRPQKKVGFTTETKGTPKKKPSEATYGQSEQPKSRGGAIFLTMRCSGAAVGWEKTTKWAIKNSLSSH